MLEGEKAGISRGPPRVEVTVCRPGVNLVRHSLAWQSCPWRSQQYMQGSVFFSLASCRTACLFLWPQFKCIKLNVDMATQSKDYA